MRIKEPTELEGKELPAHASSKRLFNKKSD